MNGFQSLEDYDKWLEEQISGQGTGKTILGSGLDSLDMPELNFDLMKEPLVSTAYSPVSHKMPYAGEDQTQ